MTKRILMASTALALAAGFESEICETVTVQTENGPVRMNKSDYDADPKAHKLATASHEAPQSEETANTLQTGGPPLAAPSAPDFGRSDNTAPQQIDPLKQAAAPVAHGENARLVMKKSTGSGKTKADRYFVVDGMGENIVMSGINSDDGYDTDEAAWAAIRALPH